MTSSVGIISDKIKQEARHRLSLRIHETKDGNQPASISAAVLHFSFDMSPFRPNLQRKDLHANEIVAYELTNTSLNTCSHN